MRNNTVERKTAETKIALSLELDGTGKSDIETGCGFMDHMLKLLAAHSGFDISLRCKGDVEVDYHHSIEDIGISLGKAFSASLGDCRGICRYANIILPMDEALILVAVDVSGRDFLAYDVSVPCQKVGDFDTELVEEFLQGFVRNAGITLHVKQLAGKNSHHIIEAIFKALARALGQAVAIDSKRADAIPSTKGTLV